eukprot:5917923-Amphidinium_carterae.1
MSCCDLLAFEFSLSISLATADTMKVQPLPMDVCFRGLDRLLDWCKHRGLKCAAVTNAPRPNAEASRAPFSNNPPLSKSAHQKTRLSSPSINKEQLRSPEG